MTRAIGVFLTVCVMLACAGWFTFRDASPAGAQEPSPAADALLGGPLPVAAPETDQQQQFSVTRRAARADDVPTPGAAGLLARGPREELGVNPALARRAWHGGAGVFIAPGRGWICLASERGTGACNRTDEAARGFLVGVERIDKRSVRVTGAVPDGVSAVQIDRADAESVVVQAHDNVYVAEMDGAPAAVRFEHAGQQRTVPLMAP